MLRANSGLIVCCEQTVAWYREAAEQGLSSVQHKPGWLCDSSWGYVVGKWIIGQKNTQVLAPKMGRLSRLFDAMLKLGAQIILII